MFIWNKINFVCTKNIFNTQIQTHTPSHIQIPNPLGYQNNDFQRKDQSHHMYSCIAYIESHI